MSDFSTIRNSLADLPMTWYPALLKAVVENARASGAFKPGGLTEFVRSIDGAHSCVAGTPTATCVYLQDGKKVVVCRDPDVKGRFWLEVQQQAKITTA